MTDASYVIGGWALTGGVVVLYAARLRQKTKRAEKRIGRAEERQRVSETLLPGGVLDDGPEPLPIVPRKVKKTRYWVAGGLCLAAVAALLIGGLSRNIVYYKTVAEAVNQPPEGRFRMMGAVQPGSVVETEDGVKFRLGAGGKEAEVIHRGDPPELFKEGAPVVCEGRWQGNVFASDRIMIKHGSEYKPPPADSVPAGDDTDTAGT